MPLRVTGVEEASQAPCIVDIDYYVPVSCKSHCPMGVRHVFLRNSDTQLFELKLPLDSLVLKGFVLVLVSGNAFSRGALRGDGPAIAGLPVISLPEGKEFSGWLPRLDIQAEIGMTCTGRLVEVTLGAGETFNRRIVHGRVQFLLADDVLVGLRVLDLTEEEQHTLREYVARHQ